MWNSAVSIACNQPGFYFTICADDIIRLKKS